MCSTEGGLHISPIVDEARYLNAMNSAKLGLRGPGLDLIKGALNTKFNLFNHATNWCIYLDFSLFKFV